VKSYRAVQEEQNTPDARQEVKRPDWVEQAVQRSLAHFRERGEPALRAPEASLRLFSAEQDDQGRTHVRWNQFRNGVRVFGGQLISHLAADAVRAVSGRVFETENVETAPVLEAAQAIEVAQTALGFSDEPASPPKARLVVLPHQIYKGNGEAGATLVYQVGLKIMDGSAGPAHHQYFVNAQNGSIVWHYNSLPSGWGGGNSLLSSRVSIPTETLAQDRYRLRDPERGNSETRDMNNQTSGAGSEFTDNDNTWGDGTMFNRQTVAVDAQYGVRMASDYFLTQHGRLGLDGHNAGIRAFVHFGTNYLNANGSRDGLYFGDGNADGSTLTPTRRPYVSLDIVGHEYTHALIDYLIPDDDDPDSDAGFIYAGESGAVEESFADIFGTEVERYSGRNFDYLIGEDIMIQGGALRDMANPQSVGLPDHYSLFVSTTSDNGGVHTNSSIMNHAYYLLAEGGTHRLSGITVPRIGYGVARWIFYRALATSLTKTARFADVRRETMRIAALDYADAPWVKQAVARAWDAVGVRPLNVFDFDGDSRSDLAVWRPSDGYWHNINSSTGYEGHIQWGTRGDIIVPGDYDGDLKTDRAVWRPGDGVWYIINSSTGAAQSFQWGAYLDVPVPGDYDGDGRTDLAVWRPGDGVWYIVLSSTGSYQTVQWGVNGDRPVPGDYDGDGRTDPAVWRPGNGVWYIINSLTGSRQSVQWGTNGDVPVPGDYDGDFRTDLAVWRYTNGVWYIINSRTGSRQEFQWGISSDAPVPADYDGDGKTDLAVWRYSDGFWHIIASSTGREGHYQWGTIGDVPVPKASKYVSPLTGGRDYNFRFGN
jgi:Zn-dependent metalloprotease